MFPNYKAGIEMNVYDFDGTIYNGDSTIDFWVYCLKKHPKILCALPSTAGAFLLFKLRICSRENFKERFYGFLKYIPNVSSTVYAFWDIQMGNIKDFYRRGRRDDDVVISASPEFLISEVCRRLGVACIASKVNPATGKLEGPNCRGEEKVRRFREVYTGMQIQEFYSDSTSDIFMAREAQAAFLVTNNIIKNWSV